MLVKPIPREEIDSWLVEESGLPVRVVNAVRQVDIRTVGQLRAQPDSELIKLRSLGRISLENIHNFFKICGQIEQGKQKFQSFKEVFALILNEPARRVLAARYGFDRTNGKVARDHATLQEIADATHVTRERVRQIQEAAIARLRSRLAQAYLQPFYDYLIEQLNQRGRIIGAEDLAPLQSDPVLAGWNACGVLLLLSDVSPARLTSYHDFFTALPPETIQRLEDWLIKVLEDEGAPLSLDALCKKVGPDALKPLDRPREAVACILDHAPDVGATLDQRYFLYRNGAQAFLVEVLSSMERPVHYRKIASAFNDRMKPNKRKGAGFILDLLNAHPRCTRVDRGIYDLKAD